VVVVGNITVGGSGKTPLVVALAEALGAAGLRVGILSRGYGGRPGKLPLAVAADSDPARCGDEPLLLALRTGCPVYVHPDRVAAAHRLLAAAAVDVLLADDGLQHYRLARDLELAVIDARFRLGNAWPLPAGPLREPVGRLAAVDYVVCNGTPAAAGEVPMRLVGELALPLRGGAARTLESFCGQVVHAVAAIGDPERFFSYLRARGLQLESHPFPDHHRYTPGELQFSERAPILMTEKDAVKCRPWAGPDTWYVPVSAELPESLIRGLLSRLPVIADGRADQRPHASLATSGDP
jgi:tetraacyldisaccharide 4'-kinase